MSEPGSLSSSHTSSPSSPPLPSYPSIYLSLPDINLSEIIQILAEYIFISIVFECIMSKKSRDSISTYCNCCNNLAFYVLKNISIYLSISSLFLLVILTPVDCEMILKPVSLNLSPNLPSLLWCLMPPHHHQPLPITTQGWVNCLYLKKMC